MKLPPVQIRKRERPPGADFQSIDIEARARQGLIAAATGVAESYADAEASSQYLTAESNTKNSLSELHSRMDNPLTNVSELNDIGYNLNDVEVGPDGESYVPTHTIAQKMWEKGTSDIKLKASKGIRSRAAKNEFNDFWLNAVDKSGGIAANQIGNLTRDYHVAQRTTAVNDAVANRDYEGAVKNLFFLKKNGFIDHSTYESQLAGIENGINEVNKAEELQRYEGLLLKDAETADDVEQLYALESYLRDKENHSSLGGKERDRIADAAEKKADENKLSLYAKREKSKAQLVSDVQLMINDKDPRVTENTIQQLFDDDIIKGPKMTEMKKSLKANQEQHQTNLALDASIAAKVSQGIAIDPSNKQERDAVNRYYEADVRGGKDAWEAAIDTMDTYRVVPDVVGGMMRGSNRADSPQLIKAAVLYNVVKREAPLALEDINSGTKLVRSVAANIELGMSVEDAAQSSIEWSQMDDVKRETLVAALRLTLADNPGTLKDLASDQYDIPWSVFEAEIPLTMNTQFNLLTEQYLTVAGTVAGAQQMAFGDLRAQWSLSKVNGDYEIMRNAPQGNVELMRSELKDRYGDGVIIRSDQLTEIQKQGREPLTYQVVRGGDAPVIETKARRNSGDFATEWREQLDKYSGSTADQLGITSKEEAQAYIDTLYTGDNVVTFDRWEWNAEESQAKENKKALKEASESYDKRRAIQEKKEVNKADWQTRNRAVELGLNPKDYTESEEGKRFRAFTLDAIKKSGSLF